MRRATRPGPAAASRLEYERRVNRVVDHVRQHLGDQLTVAGLARIAGLSPFHFHRIFTAVAGETLFGFVQRLRIERAAVALRDHPDRHVIDVALDHGFSSAAGFARAFRARFGMTATAWRAGGAERWRARERRASKTDQASRKDGKATAGWRAHALQQLAEEARMSVTVEVLPAYELACMRYVGPYGAAGIPALWTRLQRWMQARALPMAASTRLGVAYDDPSVTAPDRCRYDAGVVVPEGFGFDRWVERVRVAGGRYAVGRFAGSPHQIRAAWDAIFAAWLPGSGYQPDDRPCVEVYRGEARRGTSSGTFRCRLCLPVRPL